MVMIGQVARWTFGFSPNLAASLLMLCSFLIFTVMAILIREVGDTIPVVQVIMVRQLAALVIFAPFFWSQRKPITKPAGLGLHLTRGFSQFGAMMCGLTATIVLPLADVTAIQMAEVLIATALAAILLGEHVGWRRWSAAGVGFLGVLVMLKPFGGGFQSASLVALLGALCGAVSMIAVRMGSVHDTMFTVLFWQGLVVLVLSAPLAFWQWVPPTMADWWILALMSVLFTTALGLFTFALRMGDASALAPLHCLRLVMMAVVGWWLYAELPTITSIFGAILIFSTVIYTLARNTRRPAVVDPSSPQL